MSEQFNAADRKQVKKAADLDRRLAERQAQDIKTLMETIEGRRFIWRLLEHCRVFASIWRPSAEIHHLSGKQDVGHFVMSQVVGADEASFLKMMTEAKEYNRV